MPLCLVFPELVRALPITHHPSHDTKGDNKNSQSHKLNRAQLWYDIFRISSSKFEVYDRITGGIERVDWCRPCDEKYPTTNLSCVVCVVTWCFRLSESPQPFHRRHQTGSTSTVSKITIAMDGMSMADHSKPKLNGYDLSPRMESLLVMSNDE